MMPGESLEDAPPLSIHYTLNGTEPTVDSDQYVNPDMCMYMYQALASPGSQLSWAISLHSFGMELELHRINLLCLFPGRCCTLPPRTDTTTTSRQSSRSQLPICSALSGRSQSGPGFGRRTLPKKSCRCLKRSRL